jgi:hypothetical protein
MNEPRPIPLWARVGAGFVLSLSVIAAIGTAWVYVRKGVVPNWSWYDCFLFAWSAWSILPLFLAVAVKGTVSWGKPSSSEMPMGRYKTFASNACSIAFMIIFHHYEPIAADLFAGLIAVVIVCVALQIYFMPIKSKLENIARTKARHGFPVDQPHKIDQILKSGYFRIP